MVKDDGFYTKKNTDTEKIVIEDKTSPSLLSKSFILINYINYIKSFIFFKEFFYNITFMYVCVCVCVRFIAMLLFLFFSYSCAG